MSGDIQLISINEKKAKVIRYDGQIPNELKQKLNDDGIGDPEKKQAVFEVQGLGKVLCESRDGEHWKAIALLQEAQPEAEIESGN